MFGKLLTYILLIYLVYYTIIIGKDYLFKPKSKKEKGSDNYEIDGLISEEEPQRVEKVEIPAEVEEFQKKNYE